jgi:hypothetical protein
MLRRSTQNKLYFCFATKVLEPVSLFGEFKFRFLELFEVRQEFFGVFGGNNPPRDPTPQDRSKR